MNNLKTQNVLLSMDESLWGKSRILPGNAYVAVNTVAKRMVGTMVNRIMGIDN